MKRIKALVERCFRDKPKLWRQLQAGTLVIAVFANLLLFSVMYFYSGGLQSGMPVWLLLGFALSWLIVICILGVIFTYQNYVYEKQKKQIMEQEEALSDTLHQAVEKQTRKAEERRKKVERLSIQIMQTLANTIDAKDKYTNGHSTRVAEYAREIARRLGKSEKQQEDIYFIGLLHDIGKIGIPDEIISKASGLTDAEYNIIRSHPVIGAEILKNMTEIPDIDIGAHWHHERYDGKGYPDGLKGEEIPETARIIGVADAYDAMASKRSYRDVLPQKVVREEIARGRGSQFDPVFTDILLEMIDEDHEYRMREM